MDKKQKKKAKKKNYFVLDPVKPRTGLGSPGRTQTLDWNIKIVQLNIHVSKNNKTDISDVFVLALPLKEIVLNAIVLNS